MSDPDLTENWPDAQDPDPCACGICGRESCEGHDAADVQHAKGVRLSDFSVYMPLHKYIFQPTRELWPASSVNARLGKVPLASPDAEEDPTVIEASTWLDQRRPVEQFTWCPGPPMLLSEIVSWRTVDGSRGTDVPPLTRIVRPRSSPAIPAARSGGSIICGRSIPDHVDHILPWLAHRVQRPADKINHALVLGGFQGIGKDTLLEPVKHAVGPWNFADVSPIHILGRFLNGFAKSVVLRISEARDLGDVDRFSLYDHIEDLHRLAARHLALRRKALP